eukprot:PhM_4_TR10344/c0_g1_i1/m.48797
MTDGRHQLHLPPMHIQDDEGHDVEYSRLHGLSNPYLLRSTTRRRHQLSGLVLEQSWNNSIVPTSLHWHGENARVNKSTKHRTLIPKYNAMVDPHLQQFHRRCLSSSPSKKAVKKKGEGAPKTTSTTTATPKDHVVQPLSAADLFLSNTRGGGIAQSHHVSALCPHVSIIRSQQILDLKVTFKKLATASASDSERAMRYIYVAPYGSAGYADFVFIYDRGFNVTNEHHLHTGLQGLASVRDKELLEMLRLLTCRVTHDSAHSPQRHSPQKTNDSFSSLSSASFFPKAPEEQHRSIVRRLARRARGDAYSLRSSREDRHLFDDDDDDDNDNEYNDGQEQQQQQQHQPSNGPFLLDWASFLVLCCLDVTALPALRNLHAQFFSCQSAAEVQKLADTIRKNHPDDPHNVSSFGKKSTNSSSSRNLRSASPSSTHKKGGGGAGGSSASSGIDDKNFAMFLLSVLPGSQQVFLVRTKCFRIT